jgi:hypothetical protein
MKGKQNKYRSNIFGVVLNPKTEKIDWSILSLDAIKCKLHELKFPTKIELTDFLNAVEFENIRGNVTVLEEFDGQLELGKETKIPHYQLAIKTKSLCLRKSILKSFERLAVFVNVDIQFNYTTMKEYCIKDSVFLSDEYSGKITKYQWNLDFMEIKPELNAVFTSPFLWQKFFQDQILPMEPDSRVVDWLIDPVGNTGKSTFVRAYVSKKATDAIFVKIDNLDRMELTLILKITNYRQKYSKDPRIVFFDFPRAVDFKKVVSATALIEDLKSGHLETTFGGKFRELQIGNVHVIVMCNTAPDLSVLSEDRWRLWQLGGASYDNIIWPCYCISNIKEIDKQHNILWNVFICPLSLKQIITKKHLKDFIFDDTWLQIPEYSDRKRSTIEEHFLFGTIYQPTKYVASTFFESPNEIRVKSLSSKPYTQYLQLPLYSDRYLLRNITTDI